MHDVFVFAVWDLHVRRTVSEDLKDLELASEYRPVELERLAAVSVEVKICVQGQLCLLVSS